jgi:hypothetical protein
MPKQSGQDNKTVRGPSRPLPPSREIKRFDAPAPDPRKMPAGSATAPGVPKQADKVKPSPGGSIDPRQQRYWAMTDFILKLDLSDHQHPGNPAAQYAQVRRMLDLAKQAIGANSNRRGDLTIPSFDPHRNVGGHVTIGSWEFIEDETRNANAEA